MTQAMHAERSLFLQDTINDKQKLLQEITELKADIEPQTKEVGTGRGSRKGE